MPRQSSQGTCKVCGKTFGKVAMTRHLQKCVEEHSAKGKDRVLRLLVEGHPSPYYWLHIEMPASAKLSQLDQFLRNIWLECCGHLSEFRIADETYDVAPEPDPWTGVKLKSMSTALGSILSVGDKFEHRYDFGTTTELALKVIAERQGALKSKEVRILARNDPPKFPCAICGKPSTQVCTQCVYEGPQAWLCEEHAEEHACGGDYFLPVVNSPRVGLCGYTGESEFGR